MYAPDIENTQPLAVCLHASAGSHRQWGALRGTLERRVRTVTPDLVGYGAAAPFVRGARFRFDHEVAAVLGQIAAETGKRNGPLHLVGHSYGGAVALQLALRHPERVASLALYEPAQFLMLFEQGLRSPEAQEIRRVRSQVIAASRSPFRRSLAARIFVDYWSGTGTWETLSFKQRRRITRLVPKIVAEVDAIFTAGAAEFAGLDVPVRLICGSESPRTAIRVCEKLARTLPDAELLVIPGASHMAPCTDPQTVNPLIAEHVFGRLAESYRIAA